MTAAKCSEPDMDDSSTKMGKAAGKKAMKMPFGGKSGGKKSSGGKK